MFSFSSQLLDRVAPLFTSDQAKAGTYRHFTGTVRVDGKNEDRYVPFDVVALVGSPDKAPQTTAGDAKVQSVVRPVIFRATEVPDEITVTDLGVNDKFDLDGQTHDVISCKRYDRFVRLEIQGG